MKRVLRSCFEPLPRFMSTKSLVGLVLMLLAGTGISVYEYLESARPLEKPAARAEAAPAGARGEVHAAEPQRTRPTTWALPIAPQRWAPERSTIGQGPASSRPGAELFRRDIGPAARPELEPSACPPAVWDPTEQRVGS